VVASWLLAAATLVLVATSLCSGKSMAK